MKFINCSCYHIFIDKGEYSRFKESKSSQENFRDFSRNAVQKVQENDSTQDFMFADASSVKSEFLKYKEDANYWDSFCETLSGYLLFSQQNSQKRIEHLGKTVTPGSLLLIHCKPTDNDIDILVLIKMEQEEFANVIDFAAEYGLPFEKKALNTAFITFEEDGITALQVSRTSAFWVNFLEALPKRESSINTANSFSSIDTFLKKNVRGKGFHSDYVFLRNHLLTYYRNNTGNVVDYNELVELIFEKHKPHNRKLDCVDLASKMSALPSQKKGGFDKQFFVDMAKCSNRMLKTPIDLTDKIELNLKDGIENLEETIEAHKVGERKGIIIYTDVGYEYFKKEDNED